MIGFYSTVDNIFDKLCGTCGADADVETAGLNCF